MSDYYKESIEGRIFDLVKVIDALQVIDEEGEYTIIINQLIARKNELIAVQREVEKLEAEELADEQLKYMDCDEDEEEEINGNK